MALSWNEAKRRWEWEGSVEDLVDTVGSSDARLGFVMDRKSGAKVAMNIDGICDPDAPEPFFVESPDGENLYDAWDRREAARLLTNARRGMKYIDDMGAPKPQPRRTSKSKKKIKRSLGSAIREVK
jgi:hypothetical protein